jgi:hypothetical protein
LLSWFIFYLGFFVTSLVIYLHFFFFFVSFSLFLQQRWIISITVLECLDFAKKYSSVHSWFVSIFSLSFFFVMFSSQIWIFSVLMAFYSFIFMCVFNHKVKERDMSRRNDGNEITWIREKNWVFVLLICNGNTLSWVNLKHVCVKISFSNWIYWFN